MTKATQGKGASSGRPRTPAQRAQIEAAMAKGREGRQRKRDEAKGKNLPTASERWAMLLDGTITVKDLDIEELKAMRVRGKDGVINKRRATIPSHLAHAMRNEFISRAMTKMEDALPEVIDALVEIAKDPDAQESSRVKAIGMVMERVMGRTALDVHVSGSGFDEVAAQVVTGVVVERAQGQDD